MARIAEGAEITGALSHREFGCRRNYSAIDTLMTSLTPAQEMLRHNLTPHVKINRPTIMTNDFEGAFNSVLHDSLNDIPRHFGIPNSLVQVIADFDGNRQVYIEFDGQKGKPVDFSAGLLQGSPLSPLLYVVYDAAVCKYSAKPTELTTTYVDDKPMLQGAKSQRFSTQRLQERLTYQIKRGPQLNIKYAPANVELMHLAAGTKKVARDESTIQLYDHSVHPTNYLKLLGVWIDHRLSFKRHAAFDSSRARGSTGMLWKLTKRKGITPNTLHHLVLSAAVPAFTWGSEVWWTGVRHVIDQVTPAYHMMAPLITGLP